MQCFYGYLHFGLHAILIKELTIMTMRQTFNWSTHDKTIDHIRMQYRIICKMLVKFYHFYPSALILNNKNDGRLLVILRATPIFVVDEYESND